MAKKYAKISDYGDLLIPLSMMEKVLEQCYLVNTSYEDGKDFITKVKRPHRFEVFDQNDIDVALAQQELEGNED